MKIRFQKLLLLSVALSLPALCNADSGAHYYDLYLSGGISASGLNDNSQNVNINSFVTNTYNANATRNWNGIVGLGFGYLLPKNYNMPDIRIVLGLGADFINFGNLQGVEDPFSNGQNSFGPFDTLNYQFSAESTAIFLESRFLFVKSEWHPYFVVGLGGALNQLSDYSEVPTDPNGGASSPGNFFADNNQGAFAAEVGVGISHPIYIDTKRDTTYTLGLGYRYFYLGSGELGLSANQTTDAHLQANSLDAQTILLSLTMTFGVNSSATYNLTPNEVKNLNEISTPYYRTGMGS